MFNGPSRSWSGGESRRSASLPRSYRRKQKEFTQQATKDAKRWLGNTGVPKVRSRVGTGGQRFSRSKAGRFAYDQKQTGGQNTDRHLQRAELTREFRFPFSDFCENHDHRDRRASLCDRRHVKVRYRRSDLGALPGAGLH